MGICELLNVGVHGYSKISVSVALTDPVQQDEDSEGEVFIHIGANGTHQQWSA